MDDVDFWIFDLDNTLYSRRCELFSQVDRRMAQFIAERLVLDFDAARRLQKSYYREFGTTLRGLMSVNNVDPAEYLSFVHDVDFSGVARNPALDTALARLPGHKLVFTNASAAHARRVLACLGIAGRFDAIVDIVDIGYAPKPDPAGYRRLVERFDVEPARATMIEDSVNNLKPAHEMGMRTVLFDETEERPTYDFVDLVVEDLTAWLMEITATR